jgi:hypothetical protein
VNNWSKLRVWASGANGVAIIQGFINILFFLSLFLSKLVVSLPRTLWRKRGVFWKLVHWSSNLGYYFWGVGGCALMWLCRHVCWKISTRVDGGTCGPVKFAYTERTPLVQAKICNSISYFPNSLICNFSAMPHILCLPLSCHVLSTVLWYQLYYQQYYTMNCPINSSIDTASTQPQLKLRVTK